MNRIRFTAAVFVILLNMCLPLVRGADDTHLLIISIDGLRGDWAAHPDKHGLKVPNLRKLAARGAHADGVLGVFPSVTYPSHTTLITGCRPARHGILANSVFEPPTVKQIERWYWDYKDIRVPTILDAARSAGWTTASVGWPVNVGAPVDVLFPEVWEPSKHDEAIVAMSRLCKPPDLLAEVLTKYDLHGGPDSDINRTNVTRYIVDRYKPRLLLSHLNDLDHVEHAKGPESAEARETLERLDGYVGDIVERYEKNGLLDKTIIAVVSDHGFLAMEHSFGVNALLREKGLIRVDEKSTGPASDWDAAGWIAGGACAIVLKKPDDAATLERVREALAPYTGKPDSPIRRIIERDEIARLGSNTQAVLMLDAGDSWTFSGKLRGKVEDESKVRGMHGQMPDRPNLEATFIAAGPGIAGAARLSQMRMIDLGPTLAAAVGLKLPEAEGKADQGMLAGGSAGMIRGGK